MIYSPLHRRVVRSVPGEATTDGSDGYVQDNHGNWYRKVSHAEAQLILSGTAGTIVWIKPNGEIR